MLTNEERKLIEDMVRAMQDQSKQINQLLDILKRNNLDPAMPPAPAVTPLLTRVNRAMGIIT